MVIAITTILAGVSFCYSYPLSKPFKTSGNGPDCKRDFSGSPEPVEPGKGRWKSGTASGRISDPEDPDSEDKLGLTLSSGSEEKQGLYYILYQPGDEGNNDTEDIRQRLLPLVPLMKPSVQMEVMRLVITRKREP